MKKMSGDKSRKVKEEESTSANNAKMKGKEKKITKPLQYYYISTCSKIVP